LFANDYIKYLVESLKVTRNNVFFNRTEILGEGIYIIRCLPLKCLHSAKNNKQPLSRTENK